MIRHFLKLAVILVIFSPGMEAQGWTHTWGGAASDSIAAMSRDGNGNLYLAGATSSFGAGGQDVLLLKYDLNGNLIWTKTWGGTLDDYATAVATDPTGNIYVTGGTESFGAGWFDVFLLKFDSSGNLLWSKTWGGESYDVGHDIAFDSSGNICLAAESYSFNADSNDSSAALLKFTPTGTLISSKVWASAIPTTTGPVYNGGYSLDIDANGNVVMSGITWNYNLNKAPYQNSIFVVKYDSSGNLLWNRNWSGSSQDEAWGTKTIRADSSGNIYVVGQTSSSCTNSNHSECDFDVLILKFDPNGNFLWSRTWSGGSGYDQALSFFFDGAGNLVVVGARDEFGPSGAALVLRYDPSGDLLSSQYWTGAPGSVGYAVLLDPSGNVFVGGSATDNQGMWQDIAGIPGTETGTVTIQSGALASPSVNLGSPSGTVSSPIGMVDVGAGEEDAFVSTIPASNGSQPTVSSSCLPQYPTACQILDFGFAIVRRYEGGELLDPVASSIRAVTIRNNGNSNLAFSNTAVSFSGSNANDFNLPSSLPSDACTEDAALVPGSTCQIYVQFTPSSMTSETATLTLAGASPITLEGIGMYGFYQANTSDSQIPECFDVVIQSENQPFAGCPTPATLNSPGYVTGDYGCYLSSVAAVLSSFPGTYVDPETALATSYSAINPGNLDQDPPIPLSTQTSSDPERTLYELAGTGNLNPLPLPFFAEECNVAHPAQDQVSLDLLGACSSASGSSLSNADSTLEGYLTDHILNRHDRVILQLCADSSTQCISGDSHYVVVLGPYLNGDWSLFDPGWEYANTGQGDPISPYSKNTMLAPTYLLSTHEQGFYVFPNGNEIFRQFWVTGVKTFSTSVSLNTWGLSALSPVELLITDAEGQKVGNLSPGVDVAQISGSSYSRDYGIANDSGMGNSLGDPFGIKSVLISGAQAETYNVSVTGTGSGNFTLFVNAIDSGGNLQTVSTTGLTALGSTATYQLVYSPTPGSPVELTRVATGPFASLSAAMVSFPSQALGTSSPTQSVTLANTGDPALSIQGVSISGDFTETNTCGAILDIGKSCVINIVFVPGTIGTRTGTLSITDNSPGSPQTISLSGSGAAPFVILGGSVEQPLTNDGNGHFVARATVTNQGNVTVDSAQIITAGTTLGNASATSVSPPIASLAPGATATFTIAFPVTSATIAPLKINGTYSASTGTLSGNWSLTFRSVTLAH